MFAVVFVALHNAAHRLTCGDASISCYNVIFLFPVLAHLAWDLVPNQVACVAVCSQHAPLPGPINTGLQLRCRHGFDVGHRWPCVHQVYLDVQMALAKTRHIP
jgi:hypothetical protein